MPQPIRPFLPFTLLALALLLSCGADDPTGVTDTSLIGSWDMIAFTDGERVASVSGTWAFFEDGTLAVDAAFTFPGQRTQFLASVGRFERTGEVASLTLRGQTSTWSLEFTTDEVLLTQASPAPADNTIRLRRVASRPKQQHTAPRS